MPTNTTSNCEALALKLGQTWKAHNKAAARNLAKPSPAEHQSVRRGERLARG